MGYSVNRHGYRLRLFVVSEIEIRAAIGILRWTQVRIHREACEVYGGEKAVSRRTVAVEWGGAVRLRMAPMSTARDVRRRQQRLSTVEREIIRTNRRRNNRRRNRRDTVRFFPFFFFYLLAVLKKSSQTEHPEYRTICAGWVCAIADWWTVKTPPVGERFEGNSNGKFGNPGPPFLRSWFVALWFSCVRPHGPVWKSERYWSDEDVKNATGAYTNRTGVFRTKHFQARSEKRKM